MNIFEAAQLIDEQDRSQQTYLEFLRVPSISAGLYSLAAGDIDSQEPHSEDEVYYVISGAQFSDQALKIAWCRLVQFFT